MSAALTPAAIPAAPSLELVDGRPMARSIDVADFFGRRHRDVTRAIRNMEIPDETRSRNFAQSSVVRVTGNGARRTYPGYLMTRDGFTLLAFGFTGRKAMTFKLAYIEAFNAMEAALAHRPELQASRFAPDLQNRVWYDGEPVLASSSLAVFYGCSAKSLSTLARDSRGLFVRGRHYHVIAGGDVRRFYAEAADVAVCILPATPPVRGLMLFPDEGARYLALERGRAAMDAYAHLRRTYYAPEPDAWESPSGCLDSALRRAERLLATLQRQAGRLNTAVKHLNA